jgi:hypothetical protein
MTDVFGHRVIADLLPHPTRMIQVRKKDGQLRKPELFGLRGARNPVSVNFDSCPILAGAGRVGVGERKSLAVSQGPSRSTTSRPENRVSV